jgi:hypothetical protein
VDRGGQVIDSEPESSSVAVRRASLPNLVIPHPGTGQLVPEHLGQANPERGEEKHPDRHAIVAFNRAFPDRRGQSRRHVCTNAIPAPARPSRSLGIASTSTTCAGRGRTPRRSGPMCFRTSNPVPRRGHAGGKTWLPHCYKCHDGLPSTLRRGSKNGPRLRRSIIGATESRDIAAYFISGRFFPESVRSRRATRPALQRPAPIRTGRRLRVEFRRRIASVSARG